MARPFVIVLVCLFVDSYALQCIKSQMVVGTNLQLLRPDLQAKAEEFTRTRRSVNPGDYLETCKTGDVCRAQVYVHSASNGYASFVERGCHTVPKVDHDKCVCTEGDRHDPKASVTEKECFCSSDKCSNPAQKFVENMHKPSEGPGPNDVCPCQEKEKASTVEVRQVESEETATVTNGYFVYGNGATAEPIEDDAEVTTPAAADEETEGYFPWGTQKYRYATQQPVRKPTTAKKSVYQYGGVTTARYPKWQFVDRLTTNEDYGSWNHGEEPTGYYGEELETTTEPWDISDGYSWY